MSVNPPNSVNFSKKETPVQDDFNITRTSTTRFKDSKGGCEDRLELAGTDKKVYVAVRTSFIRLFQLFDSILKFFGKKRKWTTITIKKDGKDKKIIVNINSLLKRTNLTRGEFELLSDDKLKDKLLNPNGILTTPKKLNQFFPNAKLITLEKKGNKRPEELNTHLNNIGQKEIKYNKFKAVYGKDLPKEEIDKMEQSTLTKILGGDDRPGRTGCYYSHLYALKEARVEFEFLEQFEALLKELAEGKDKDKIEEKQKVFLSNIELLEEEVDGLNGKIEGLKNEIETLEKQIKGNKGGNDTKELEKKNNLMKELNLNLVYFKERNKMIEYYKDFEKELSDLIKTNDEELADALDKVQKKFEKKKKEKESVLILEDDVRFTTHQHSEYYLEKAMKELEGKDKDWGMLFLGHFDYAPWSSEDISDHLVRPSEPVDLHGYVVHQRFYKHLIALMEEELRVSDRERRPVDVVIRDYVKDAKNVYATKKHLAVQKASSNSDILGYDVNWIKYDQDGFDDKVKKEDLNVSAKKV